MTIEQDAKSISAIFELAIFFSKKKRTDLVVGSF